VADCLAEQKMEAIMAEKTFSRIKKVPTNSTRTHFISEFLKFAGQYEAQHLESKIYKELTTLSLG